MTTENIKFSCILDILEETKEKMNNILSKINSIQEMEPEKFVEKFDLAVKEIKNALVNIHYQVHSLYHKIIQDQDKMEKLTQEIKELKIEIKQIFLLFEQMKPILLSFNKNPN